MVIASDSQKPVESPLARLYSDPPDKHALNGNLVGAGEGEPQLSGEGTHFGDLRLYCWGCRSKKRISRTKLDKRNDGGYAYYRSA